MRLSQIDPDKWSQTAAYVDTLLLPVYRIRFPDKRLDVEEAKQVNRIAALVEGNLKGRLFLTSPIPYGTQTREVWHRYLKEVINEFAAAPFLHVVILAPTDWELPSFSDMKGVIGITVSMDEDIETAANRVVEQIVSMWQTSEEV
ncbi:DUF2487 family protein [Desmospora activa]|uniref:Uncharacterized protein DUF2487 n=1 Tax=Desmospora activa DSM 45169 TaxID=1121389 RepID=A0A2T4ZA01_9BACL|nr:DUF2487 family protein [Desmospora activa]PTM58703.1 uncharacterized protein DUF2487 [Desmospora activa DSM 45169]